MLTSARPHFIGDVVIKHPLELSLTVFTEFAEFSAKNICH